MASTSVVVLPVPGGPCTIAISGCLLAIDGALLGRSSTREACRIKLTETGFDRTCNRISRNLCIPVWRKVNGLESVLDVQLPTRKDNRNLVQKTYTVFSEKIITVYNSP